MAIVTLTVPDAAIPTLNARAQSIGYANAKAMTVDFLKRQYRIQKKIEAEQGATDLVRAPVTDPDIT